MAEPGAIRLLLVDDDPAIARMVQHILTAHGFSAATHVGTGREALAQADDVDLVLLDQQLPDASGLEILDALRSRPSPPAVVLITAHGNETFAAAALRRGADDYLAKDASLSELLPQVVERVRRTRELRKALAAAERELVRAERLAAIGEMTVTLHHEINNPLMAAFAELQLLLADREISDAQRHGLTAVQQALGRIRDIVRQIGDLQQAKTTVYTGGIRMIDLSRNDPPAVDTRGIAVTHVPDEDLGRVTSLLLRRAGFRVQRCRDIEELQAESAGLGVSLVLVAGGATPLGADPLGGFRPAPERGYRLVALVADDGVTARAARAAGADDAVTVPFDPVAFTELASR